MSAPVVQAQMLIRKPAAEVFNAFVDPSVTTKFWFTKASGKLAAGARVRWDWEMYGVHDEIEVKAFEPNARIVFEWSAPQTNTVELRVEPHAKGAMIYVTNSDLKGDDLIAQALDLAQGWNLVLAGAKAWLEHGVQLNLVADKAPNHNVAGWDKQ